MQAEISVIIPTFDRIDSLLRCLAALQKQTMEQARIEIIVVDDGSTDGTRDRLQPFISNGSVRCSFQPNFGPARARNVGIRAATGKVLLFIGDDIMATPRLLEEHLSYHTRFADEPLAVVGFTDWSTNLEITPLMKYPGIDQFGYHRIRQRNVDPQNLPFNFFYTSNVSISRRFLIENDLFFDEDFAFAMGEDGELAYRMQKRGLRIVYNPRALAYHEHPMTFEYVCRRWFLRGQVAVLQAKKHPELGDLSFLHLSWKGRFKRQAYRLAAFLISPLLELADRQRWDICRSGLCKWYDFVFQVRQFEGLRNGLRVYDVDI